MKQRIKLNYDSNCDGKSIFTDERRIKQILVNLLSNAIKFTDEKKEVGLDVYWDEDNNKVDFTIWDEGIGISDSELPNLFKPFVQLDSSLSRKHEGTGLGLSLVEKLAKMHCGSVTLESCPESGSKFTVSLPHNINIMNNDKKKIENEIIKQNKTYSIQNSIIYDERILTAKLISKYMDASNIQSTIHSQGEGTIDKVIGFKPDIIILDVILPDITGWQVLAELKSKSATKNIPIIVISIVDEASKGFELGAACYLMKPVSEHQLMLAIKQELTHRDKDYRALIVMSDKMTSIKQMYTILIVDENEANINYIMDSLIAHDYRVIVGRNGSEAVKRANEVEPDMIIIDHQMSIADGCHAIVKIREISKMIDIPIIVMSSLILPGDKEKYIAYGADIFLPKPINLEGLLYNINEIRSKDLSDKLLGE
ncbi:MAG: response regulator [Planctomycetes bacterium]|nr:response regulator [Planctomycetota bacterium]